MFDVINPEEGRSIALPDFKVRLKEGSYTRPSDYEFEVVVSVPSLSNTSANDHVIKIAEGHSGHGALTATSKEIFSGQFIGLDFECDDVKRAFFGAASSALQNALMNPGLYSSDNSHPSPYAQGGNHLRAG